MYRSVSPLEVPTSHVLEMLLHPFPQCLHLLSDYLAFLLKGISNLDKLEVDPIHRHQFDGYVLFEHIHLQDKEMNRQLSPHLLLWHELGLK